MSCGAATPLDQIAAKAFEGYIVRKDLVRRFKGQYPVPTYVGEFLLGRYCASTDEEEIEEGLEIVERQLREPDRPRGRGGAVQGARAGEGRSSSSTSSRARLDAKTDSLSWRRCRACS